MKFNANRKVLYNNNLRDIIEIINDSSLDAEEKLRRIDETRGKYKQIEAVFAKEYQEDGIDVERTISIPNNRYITNEDCYAIFFEDNTFTIAYRYARGVPSGIHHIHQIFLEDLVSGSTLDMYSKASFDRKERPYPMWVTKTDGVIEHWSRSNNKCFYFIKLDSLVCLNDNEDREFGGSSPINLSIMQEIIGVANTYLKEHPLFVKETLLKKVKKQ